MPGVGNISVFLHWVGGGLGRIPHNGILSRGVPLGPRRFTAREMCILIFVCSKRRR